MDCNHKHPPGAAGEICQGATCRVLVETTNMSECLGSVYIFLHVMSIAAK